MELNDLSINLQTKTISDTFRATSFEQPTIGEIITGTVLGFSYAFTVDNYSYSEETKKYNITGTYDINNKINLDINGSTSPSVDFTDGAKGIAGNVVGKMGKTAIKNFDDFFPTGILTKNSEGGCYCNLTYMGLLQRVFGWTDIIPTTLVNIFERGSNIYFLQRGHETGTVILDPKECYYPNDTYKKMDLLYASNNDYYLTGDLPDNFNPNTSVDPEEGQTLISGVFTVGENTQTFSYGLLTSEAFASTDNTKIGTTTYTYDAIVPPANLTGKAASLVETKANTPPPLTTANIPYRVVTSVTNESTLVNVFATNGRDLIKSTETIITTTKGFNYIDTNFSEQAFADEVVTVVNETIYSDMGQGHWGVAVYRDGVLMNSQIVTGNPGAKASPWAIKDNSTYSGHTNKVGPKRVKLSGRFSGDMSINVSDSPTLNRIASAIESLNGKTEEKISLTYFGNNFCDFINKISWRGNVYYLESNNIHKTPEQTMQQIVIVRWY